MARKAQAARLKPHVGTASEDHPIEGSTSLKCYNIADESIFVEGLKKAGLKVVPQPFSIEKDANQLVIVLQSQQEAYQIMKAFHGCELEGQTMHINIIDIGKRLGNVKGKLPKVKKIRDFVLEAFRRRKFKKEVFARENPEFAEALKGVCRKIRASKKATKRRKANKHVMKVQEEAVAVEMSDSGSSESKSLGEEIHGQKGREERGERRDDAMKQGKAGETQSDLPGEKCRIQDTARMITPTRSPTPNDFLSALYASLK